MNQSPSFVAWPPLYRVKKHKLAKHVKLRATHAHGLEITIPPRFNLRDIPAILEEHKHWIVKQLSNLQPLQVNEIPEEIVFHATDESWKIYTMECNSKLEMIQRPNREIVLVGKLIDKKQCRHKLLIWIRNLSKTWLVSQLKAISLNTHLYFEKVTIRDQQTVWGSCTSTQSINLNYKLIFLPHRLVQYVIIHELCHTKYLNHSDKFWKLVAVHDPNWREHRRELRHANKYIPGWIQVE